MVFAVVAQTPLEPAQALFDPLDRTVDAGINVASLVVALDLDAGANMHRAIGAEAASLLRDHDSGLDRGIEVFGDTRSQLVFDVGAQRVANVQLLAFDQDLHLPD